MTGSAEKGDENLAHRTLSERGRKSEQRMMWEREGVSAKNVARKRKNPWVQEVMRPLWNEYGTHETVKARFWPWSSGKRPFFSLLARQQRGRKPGQMIL